MTRSLRIRPLLNSDNPPPMCQDKLLLRISLFCCTFCHFPGSWPEKLPLSLEYVFQPGSPHSPASGHWGLFHGISSQEALVVKNLPVNAGDTGCIHGSGRQPGDGHGNPLQYSCLENPMDRGAPRAAVHRVAKSQKWLKWLSMHICKAMASFLNSQLFVTNWLLCSFRNSETQQISYKQSFVVS